MSKDKKSQDRKKSWDESLQEIFDQFSFPWKKVDEQKKYPAPLSPFEPKKDWFDIDKEPWPQPKPRIDEKVIAEMMDAIRNKNVKVSSNSDLNHHKAVLESSLGPAYVMVINTILLLPEDSPIWNDVPINYLVEMAIQRLEMERPGADVHFDDFLRRVSVLFNKKFPQVRGRKLAKELDIL